jgi:predicted DsbA family dithiol-disulfide isomerase
MEKMKIEIWSDVMCPFCYIGKRRLEKSLQDFKDRDSIEIEWKSYQLNPDMVTDTNVRMDEYLATHKGMTVEQAQQLHHQVSQMAAAEGLTYNMDKAVVANSFKAHVLAHFAKAAGKQDDVEELLFKSHFTDGKNIDDIEVLKSIAETAGLDKEQFEHIVRDGVLDDEVKMDIHEAQQIGVRGVPFFVFNRKYAISGAQPIEAFTQTLEKSITDWTATAIKLMNTDDGDSCGIDGCH